MKMLCSLTSLKINLFVSQTHISFSPTLEQQRKCPGCKRTKIDGDFIVKYDVKREESLGDVQVSGMQGLRKDFIK